MGAVLVDRGLEGVVVGETVLSNVEGQIGRLTYRGYDIPFEPINHRLGIRPRAAAAIVNGSHN